MDRILRTGGGRPRVGMTAHTWGWPPTRGDGGFAPRDGRSHLGMAGLHLETATHTWLWRVYVWRWPKKRAKKRKAGVFFPSIFDKRQFCHSRNQLWRQVPQPRRIPSIQPSAANQGAGFGNGGKSIHAKRQPRTIFSKHRASIRNQHPRNTCKHQRNPSAFSMKPRVLKPPKMGGSWNSNGGWFSLPCFLK